MKYIITILTATLIFLDSGLSAFPIKEDTFHKYEGIRVSKIFDCHERNVNGHRCLMGNDEQSNSSIMVFIGDFDIKSNSGLLHAVVVKDKEVCRSSVFSSKINDGEIKAVIAQFSFENTEIKLVVSLDEDPLFNFAYWAVK